MKDKARLYAASPERTQTGPKTSTSNRRSGDEPQRWDDANGRAVTETCRGKTSERPEPLGYSFSLFERDDSRREEAEGRIASAPRERH